ncbi:hypothetical protein IMSAGC011_00617 [Lachnospiraceae bacterium]|nr:hypothetical protein IMSAGC011_00617 [Lachnospiraceae bacterium]
MSNKIFSSIDMVMTGQILKNNIRKCGYTVREIQKLLNLSCPQPIYRWMRGRTMPSLDNLYMLNSILGTHMEDLLLPRQDDVWIIQWGENQQEGRRLWVYEQRKERLFQK